MDYDWITPQVAVGGALADRSDAAELAAQGVTHVVNMCLEQSDEAYFEGLSTIRLASFGLADGHNDGTLGCDRLGGAIDYIVDTLASGNGAKIYLHCAAGISRSVAVMCGVLMRLEGVSLAGAVERVRAARPIANPHPAHLLALLQLA
ncbi:MAG: dual specificity protein phosphatase family protein [Cyanobacteria bacterium REEB65]|nr:dual specificity protein phosphatase family protein [Cyanobacteria bacterium REEB65]